MLTVPYLLGMKAREHIREGEQHIIISAPSSLRFLENNGNLHKQTKPNDLQKRQRHQKRLPPKPQTDDPNDKRPARIRQTPRGGTNMPRHTQPKEVEQRDTNRDRQPAVHHRGRGDHLHPPALEIEERRELADGGDREDGEEQEH